jgi:hypothetical protein
MDIQRNWQPPLALQGTLRNSYWTLVGPRFTLKLSAGCFLAASTRGDDVCPLVLKITQCVLIRLETFYFIPFFHDFPDFCSEPFVAVLTRFEHRTITFLSRQNKEDECLSHTIHYAHLSVAD